MLVGGRRMPVTLTELVLILWFTVMSMPRAGTGGSAPGASAGTAAGASAPDHRATVDGQSSAHPS